MSVYDQFEIDEPCLAHAKAVAHRLETMGMDVKLTEGRKYFDAMHAMYMSRCSVLFVPPSGQPIQIGLDIQTGDDLPEAKELIDYAEKKIADQPNEMAKFYGGMAYLHDHEKQECPYVDEEKKLAWLDGWIEAYVDHQELMK